MSIREYRNAHNEGIKRQSRDTLLEIRQAKLTIPAGGVRPMACGRAPSGRNCHFLGSQISGFRPPLPNRRTFIFRTSTLLPFEHPTAAEREPRLTAKI
jgi:hypothetical protein